MRSGRPDNGCAHVPELTRMPGHPDFVQVECMRCHMRTGFAPSVRDAWEAWREGNVVMPYDFMGDD